MDRIRSITVFCGSSDGRDKAYREAAEKLGKAMADRDIALVYGGGSRGLMGIIAETVHDAGGHVTGVLPESMNTSAVRQKSVESEIIIVPSMHERKKTMYAMGDAYIAMPGGIGTMEELCEIYTWRQLRYHSKNIGLLNTEGYWDPFIAMLDRGVHDGFISEAVRNIIIAEEDPERLIDRLGSENSPLPPKF